jgi:hypothetical protein
VQFELPVRPPNKLPPSLSSQEFHFSIIFDTMSSTTPSTYTSAATQTTPPTSQSTVSASALPSRYTKAPKTALSPSAAIVLRPHDAADIPEGPLDDVFPLLIKAAALLVGASIERQLMLSATNDIFTAHIFGAILWFVFGGYRKFIDDPGSPLVPPDASRHVSSNVESWLGKVRSASDATTTVVSSPVLQSEVSRVDSGYGSEKPVSIDAYDADQAFLDFAGMVDVFSEFEDHWTVLVWMDGLAGVFDEPEYTSSVDEEFPALDEEFPTQADSALPPGFALTTTGVLVLAEHEPWLSALLKLHGYPIFRLGGDHNEEFKEEVNHNFSYPIIAEHISEAVSNYTGWPSAPGRPVIDDVQDIKFLYSAVCDKVPTYVIQALELRDPEYWTRYRCGKTFSNLCREMLVLQWQAINSPHANIKSLSDVMAIETARVRRYRPQCSSHERQFHGPGSAYRPYLSAREEYGINFGCVDQCRVVRLQEEVCPLFQLLKDAPDFKKPPSDQNPAVAWLENMDESQQLDPNAYEACDCMRKAAELVMEYRHEAEHGYDPPSQVNFLYFPTLFNEAEALRDRVAAKLNGEETAADGRIPRCQQFKQNCSLHEMVTNNIYVAVDTAYCNINDMLTNPSGPLPAPGMLTSTYPEGFRPEQLFLEIPYDDLPERCIYGKLHPQVDGFCQLCSGGACAPQYPVRRLPPGIFNSLDVSQSYAEPSSQYPVAPAAPMANVARNAYPIW